MRTAAPAVPDPLATDDVPSPCVSVCVMDAASGYCMGCWRSLDEIASWSELDGAAKRAVIATLPARRARWESHDR